MKHVFVELQKSTSLSNFACAEYLGISEASVQDRRNGRYEPKKCELIALAMYGTSELDKALKYIQSLS
ncbi:hypothetical protein [Aliivibrio sp. S10_S31]|uniref:hypothetical protein n=1 Tax=Aliivibrio sp. S10_S31 TaxID=2720224 RepID=UPI00080E9617|nr:hypothetical protein [Aliivibrio sp. S10_S31]MBD1567936.1 hypothetical protein [Aliivibrio sp. S10_S31]OCH43692.1 hypothetical protein A6E02_11380 [Aliivibrio fischeri]